MAEFSNHLRNSISRRGTPRTSLDQNGDVDTPAAGTGTSAGPMDQDTIKPTFHVMAATGWSSDPHGAIFYNGRHHLFHQHINNGCQWDWGLSWAHVCSRDLVHWERLPEPIKPAPMGLDADGCFSGCSAIDPETGTPMLFYVGARLKETVSKMPPHEQHLPPPEHDIQLHFIETQMCAIAEPGDDKLVKWNKAVPWMQYPPANMPLTAWRDPCLTFRGDGKDSEWMLLIGSGVRGQGGCVLVYRTHNLKQGWRYDGVLCSWPTLDLGLAWECPYLVKLKPLPLCAKLLNKRSAEVVGDATTFTLVASVTDTATALLEDVSRRLAKVREDPREEPEGESGDEDADDIRGHRMMHPLAAECATPRTMTPRGLGPIDNDLFGKRLTVSTKKYQKIHNSEIRLRIPKDSQQTSWEWKTVRQRTVLEAAIAATAAAAALSAAQGMTADGTLAADSAANSAANTAAMAAVFGAAAAAVTGADGAQEEGGVQGATAATMAANAATMAALMDAAAEAEGSPLSTPSGFAATPAVVSLIGSEDELLLKRAAGDNVSFTSKRPCIPEVSSFASLTIDEHDEYAGDADVADRATNNNHLHSDRTSNGNSDQGSSSCPTESDVVVEVRDAAATGSSNKLQLKEGAQNGPLAEDDLQVQVDQEVQGAAQKPQVSPTGLRIHVADPTDKEPTANRSVPQTPLWTRNMFSPALMSSRRSLSRRPSLEKPREEEGCHPYNEQLAWTLLLAPDACNNPILHFMGSYNSSTGKYGLDNALGPMKLDLGDTLYAPTVYTDPKGRNILWGWMQEHRSDVPDAPAKCDKYSYAGCISLPRLLYIKHDRMFQLPLPELTQLRTDRFWEGTDILLPAKTPLPIPDVASVHLDIELSVHRGTARKTCLLIRSWRENGEGSAVLMYDWEQQKLEVLFREAPPKNVYPDLATGGPRKEDDEGDVFTMLQGGYNHAQQAEVPATSHIPGRTTRPEGLRVGGFLEMEDDEPLELRIFLDGSCLEVFTGTGEALTTRVYRGLPPQPLTDAGLQLVAIGGSSTVSSMTVYEVGSCWVDDVDA